MTGRGAARAGWLLSAVCFATLLSSILHVDHVGLPVKCLLLLLVIIATIRPDIGVLVVVAATPVAWYLVSQVSNSAVAWAEVIVCATITGVSLNSLGRRGDGARLPFSISAAAILFGALVVASLIASFAVKALRFGPGFTDALVNQLTHEYFIDMRGFPALHAGLLLLEGILLFAVAARIAGERRGDDGFLRRMAAAAAAAAALAAVLNIARLLRAAWRGASFWASLFDLADRLRWNVHYPDVNAAGSYFVMAALLAAALAVSARGSRRMAWTLSALTIGMALWLTSSRVALLAAGVAPGAVLLLTEPWRGRARARRAGAIAAAGIVVLGIVAVALPQRGSQKSSLLAADVRLGLIQTGARMIASRPVFGIGLAEFYQRSGEFSSQELIAKFPVAVHENAHNNFLQVAAELGLAGGLLLAWLMGAALVAIGRHAVAIHGTAPPMPRDPRFLLLTLAALGAFVLTCLGGHPLLIPEPGYVFWTLLGVATGSAAAASDAARPRLRWLVPIGLVAIALALPWQIRAMRQDADLEHVGIGVSRNWQLSPDGIRYREAQGHATLFIPAGAVAWSVYPLADQPLRLELKLDGRVADVVSLAPRRWNDLTLPARTEIPTERYARLDLRILDSDDTRMWMTKVQPVR